MTDQTWEEIPKRWRGGPRAVLRKRARHHEALCCTFANAAKRYAKRGNERMARKCRAIASKSRAKVSALRAAVKRLEEG